MREENQAIRALLLKLDAHLPGERLHAERTAVFATAVGYELGLRDQALLHLRWSAQLHDVGKLLLDRARLDQEEHFRCHPEIAAGLPEMVPFAVVIEAIRHHHERFDGTGYPSGLAGESIPIASRILAVSESFDAMVVGHYGLPVKSDREALAELEAGSGTQFDPAAVDAFRRVQPLIQPLVLR